MPTCSDYKLNIKTFDSSMNNNDFFSTFLKKKGLWESTHCNKNLFLLCLVIFCYSLANEGCI